MKLVIHDTLTTTAFVEPIRLGWLPERSGVTLAPELRASDVPAEAFALLASPECTLLVDTHHIVPDVAVVAAGAGAIAMRTPRRPDEISDATVLLYGVSAASEILARALLWPHFGISTVRWVTEPAADVTVTIVEGAMALQEPEAGHSEDLVRSWYVMTGLPVVTHLLLAPSGAGDDAVAETVGFLRDCETLSHERRRELRQHLDTVYGIERSRLIDVLSRQRYRLEAPDRDALVALIVKGAGGSHYLPLTRLPIRESTDAESV